LFSGLYARQHGLLHNGIALNEDIELLSHAFAQAGYQTHGVGKFHFQPILAPADLNMPDSNAFWANPENKNWQGPFYGFDTVDILIGESAAATEGGHYAQWLEQNAPEVAPLYQPENALSKPPADLDEVWKSAVPEEYHYNTWITNQACEFLEKVSDDKPFFMFVSYPDPHHPFSPPAPWCDMYDPADMPMPSIAPGELENMPDYIKDGVLSEEEPEDGGKSYVDFLRSPGTPREQGFMTTTEGIGEESMRLAIAHTYGMVSMIDACVGRIVDTLSATGDIDDTIIVFTSDHGELLGDHGLIRKGPAPYRQVLNIPMIIAGPDIPSGIQHTALTSHVDVKATLLDLVGIDGDHGEGASFAKLICGESAVKTTALFAEYHPRAVADQYNQTVTTEDWRLTIYPRRSVWGELFDRRNDPNEHNNLFNDPRHLSIRNELAGRIMAKWPTATMTTGKVLAVY
jgi:arylsulfatase A-like enzyme